MSLLMGGVGRGGAGTGGAGTAGVGKLGAVAGAASTTGGGLRCGGVDGARRRFRYRYHFARWLRGRRRRRLGNGGQAYLQPVGGQILALVVRRQEFRVTQDQEQRGGVNQYRDRDRYPDRAHLDEFVQVARFV